MSPADPGAWRQAAAALAGPGVTAALIVQCGLDWLRPPLFGLRDEIDDAVMNSLLAREKLSVDRIVLHNLPMADDLQPGELAALNAAHLGWLAQTLDASDRRYLERAISISRHALEDEGKTPFGAVVVVGGQIVGEGTSRVVELHDPTAHAEVMALRSAGAALSRHLLEDGVMYCSSEPCPMCLIACYWARIPRVVFAATSHDVATYGFEDLQFYRELTLPAGKRVVQEDAADGPLHQDAAGILRAWADQLPFDVEAKY